MRGYVQKLSASSFYWMRVGLSGIASHLQRGITALEDRVVSSPTLFSQASDDPAYHQHIRWHETWVRQLQALQQVLTNYPIPANSLDQLLGLKWTTLLSEQGCVVF